MGIITKKNSFRKRNKLFRGVIGAQQLSFISYGQWTYIYVCGRVDRRKKVIQNCNTGQACTNMDGRLDKLTCKVFFEKEVFFKCIAIL